MNKPLCLADSHQALNKPFPDTSFRTYGSCQHAYGYNAHVSHLAGGSPTETRMS